MTAAQSDFVAHVVTRLTANGHVGPDALYEPPFTGIASGGPEDLFEDADVTVLFGAIAAVTQNALPQEGAA